MRKGSLIAAVAMALGSQALMAAPIVSYTNGYITPTVVTGASAGAIAPAPKVNSQDTTVLGNVSNSFYVSQPFFTVSRANTTESGTAANVYFTFTASATAGNELDLSSFTMNVNRGGSSEPRTYDVRTSVDNFATSLTGGPVAITTVRPSSSLPTGTTWTNVSLPLSSAAFQNLSAITVRVYAMTPGVLQNIDVDNVAVNGVVSAVPEPAAMAVIGMGTLLLGRRRRSVR